MVLAGSARRESLNKRLARVAAARVAALGGEGVFLDLADYRMRLYDGDYETANGVPGPARALGEQVAAADGLMIASPEYNGSYPALLKNTIDWLTRIDRRIWVRPTALLSASPGPGGGRRGLVVLRLALDHMRVPLLERHFSLPSAGDALAGETLRDTGAAAELDRLVADLLTAASAR
ncbi:MAG: NAD(P)H-dependent oxidoreductase [Spirochaetaceae bacterium]|nr:NAD(P)H-dependent oxidoreductase [Spirochaetaceae bacterium]